jgi:hypothetical protein
VVASQFAGALVGAIFVTIIAISRTSAADLDFSAADFNILSAKSGDHIGSVHYGVIARSPGRETVGSLARYNDGQYDVERDEFDTGKDGALPAMSAYEHTFYRPDGTVFLISKADFGDGNAICTSYEGGRPSVVHKTLSFPPNAYAGAAMMLPLRQSLRRGASGPIVMYDFVCIPGPKLVKVEAYPQSPETWGHYPGALTRAVIRPDFGWLDFVIAPFVSEMYAWFDPASGFSFVGGKFARFYKGPEIILARKPSAENASAANEGGDLPSRSLQPDDSDSAPSNVGGEITGLNR